MTNLTFTKTIARVSVFELSLIKKSEGFIQFKVSGENAKLKFANESGGHRFQRIPPTERNGRVHTSTITVVVLGSNSISKETIDPKDITWFACRGSGNGGQNRNKRDTAVTVVHKPTGEWVRCEEERSQLQNRELATKRLNEKINGLKFSAFNSEVDQKRKDLAGSGMRGDKIRTIRVRDNVVTNHLNGKKTSYNEYIKGDFRRIM